MAVKRDGCHEEEAGGPSQGPDDGPLLRSAPARGSRCVRRVGLCCLMVLVLLALLAWGAQGALGEALQLICLGLNVQSLDVESLCDNPLTVNVGVETISGSALSVSFTDLTFGLTLAGGGRTGLDVVVPGRHSIERGTRTHALGVRVAVRDELQVGSILQMLADVAVCLGGDIIANMTAAGGSAPPRADGDGGGGGGASGGDGGSNCTRALVELAESTDIQISALIGASVPFGPVWLPVRMRISRTLVLNAEARAKMGAAIDMLRSKAACPGELTLGVPEVSAGEFTWEGIKFPELSAERTRADSTVSLTVNGSIVARIPPLALRVCATSSLDVAAGGGVPAGASSRTGVFDVPSLDRALANTSAPTSGCIGTLSTQPFVLGGGVRTLIEATGVVTYGHGAGVGDLSRLTGQAATLAHAAEAAMGERLGRGRSLAQAAQPPRVPAAAAADGGEDDMLSPLHFAELVSRGQSVVVRGASDAEALESARRLGGSDTDDGAHAAALRALASVQGSADAPVAGSRCLVQRLLQQVGLKLPLGALLPVQIHALVEDAAAGAACLIGVSMAYGLNSSRAEQVSAIAQLDTGAILQDCALFLSNVVQDSKLSTALPRSDAEAMAERLGDAAGRLTQLPLRFETVPLSGGDGESADGGCRLSAGHARADGAFRPRRAGSVLSCERACVAEPTCAAIEFDLAHASCVLWTRTPRARGPARAPGEGALTCRRLEAVDAGALSVAALPADARGTLLRLPVAGLISLNTCKAQCAQADGCLLAEYWASSPAANCALWFEGEALPASMQPAPPPRLEPRRPPAPPPPPPPPASPPPPAPPRAPPPPPPRCADGVADLALGQPTSASAAQSSAAAAVAHLVDGSALTQWATGAVGEAEVTVDLGAHALLSRVRVSWATVGGVSWVGAGAVDTQVWVGAGGADRPTLVAARRSSGEGVDDVQLSKGAAGRIVRVAFSRPSRTGFAAWSLEVLGCIAPDQPPPAPPRPPPPRPSPPASPPPPPPTRASNALALPAASELLELTGAASSASSECYTSKDLSDYRGLVNVTSGGHACQKWSEQSPHAHEFRPELHPGVGLGDHNYCRAVGSGWAWCYTLIERPKWQYCRVGARRESCSGRSAPAAGGAAVGADSPLSGGDPPFDTNSGT